MLGVLSLVGWMVADSRGVTLEQADQDTGTLLALLDEDIRQSIETYDIALQTVVAGLHEPGRTAGDARTQELILLARAATATYPGRMVVIDERGAAVLDSATGGSADDWLAGTTAFDYHRGHRWMGLHVSGPFRDPHSGAWVLAVSRRLERDGGAFAGIAIGTLDLGYFRNLFYSIALPANDGIALWSFDHNLVLGRPYVDREVGTRAEDQGLFDHLERLLQGHYEVAPPEAPETRLVSYRQVGDLPLVLLAYRSKAAVLAEWQRHAVIALLGAFLLTGVAILLGGASALEIRRRAQAEREMRVAQGLAEAASQAKSRFLAVMSHELRSPLNAVIGFADLIAGESRGPIGDRRYVGYAEDIHSSATHLLALINDVLDHAKADAGHLELVIEPVGLDDVIGFAVRMLQPRAAEARVALAAEKSGLAVQGDERRLRQVLINLLTNSVKFTPAEGRVTVAARRLPPAEGGGIEIRVTDTGIGIAEGDMDRIFEPFQQATGAAAGREGTGLGLPLTKRLVELHGGTIHAESRLGAGTTITIRLPEDRVFHPPEAVS